MSLPNTRLRIGQISRGRLPCLQEAASLHGTSFLVRPDAENSLLWQEIFDSSRRTNYLLAKTY